MNTRNLDRLTRVRELSLTGATRTIRQKAHLSLREVAVAVGVDTSTVARWEKGERQPTGSAAMRYADLIHRLEAKKE